MCCEYLRTNVSRRHEWKTKKWNGMFLPRDTTKGVVLLWQSRLSVRPSLTLRYRDHIGCNSYKISPLVSLGCWLFADINTPDLLQGEHPEILTVIGEGYWKSGFRHTKALISLKRGEIGPRLLLRTNRKSYTRFRLVQKSTTSKWDSRSVIGLDCAVFYVPANTV